MLDLLSDPVFFSPFLRSRASDHTEDGDSRFHASTHPGDAGELRRCGGTRRWGRKGEEGGTNGAAKPPPKSISNFHPFPELYPCVLQPLAPLQLNFLHLFFTFPPQKRLTLWCINSVYINQPGANHINTTVGGGVGQTGTPWFCVKKKKWFLSINGLQKKHLSSMKRVQLAVCLCNILYI